MTSQHLTLIPFGLRSADQRLVDVSEVPQGLACTCVCPSCNAPLIARKGEVNQWHFAHASRGMEGGEIRPCELSFFVSVALMAKQMFLECKGLVLPDYVQTVARKGPLSRCVYRTSVTVTRSRRVEPDHWRPDGQLEGQSMDLVCEVEGVPLGILLQRPDRRAHLSTRPLRGKRVGVLEIDLLETLSLFRSQGRRGNSEGFHRALARFLFDRPAHKRWLYHPRQGALIRRASEELKAQVEREEDVFRQQRLAEQQLRRQPERPVRREVAAAPPGAPVQAWPAGLGTDAEHESDGVIDLAAHGPIDDTSLAPDPERQPVGNEPVRYECVLCEHTWTGTRRGLNPCSKCGSHLYRRELPGDEG